MEFDTKICARRHHQVGLIAHVRGGHSVLLIRVLKYNEVGHAASSVAGDENTSRQKP